MGRLGTPSSGRLPMFGSFCALLLDELWVVALPQRLVLKNRRLGTFYKVLQCVLVLLCIVYCVYSHFFFQPHNVQPWGVSIWSEKGSVVDSRPAPPHCREPAAYNHHDETTSLSYKPTACKVLPTGEALGAAERGKGRLFPSFVEEVTAWEGMGGECGAAAQEACLSNTSRAGYVYEETVGNGRCSCTLREQFLVENPEEQGIGFTYGYEVDLSDGERTNILRSGILEPANYVGSPHDLKEQPSDLLTVFLAPNGKACEFGGKSQWKRAESIGGILGTLGELLTCAGVTLDSKPRALALSSHPHFRTMGLRIELHLDVTQDLLGETTVFVRAVAVPLVTATRSNDVVLSTFPMPMAKAHRSRRVHGVDVSVAVFTGRIHTFHWFSLLRGFVDIAVVMQVPRHIVYVVAMYMLGLTSQIYRGVARSQLNIFSEFHSSVANLMLAEVAFRGLVGNWHSQVTELSGLTPQMLCQHLRNIFLEDSDHLSECDIQQMASMVFMVMDTGQSGEISCSEFIHACTDGAAFNMSRVAQYFDENAHKVPTLRKLLDDTDHVRKTALQRVDGTMSIADFRDLDESFQVDDVTRSAAPTVEIPLPSVCDPVAVARLEQRMQDLEQHCEQALELLRESVSHSPSTYQQGCVTGLQACPVSSPSTPTIVGRCSQGASDLSPSHAEEKGKLHVSSDVISLPHQQAFVDENGRHHGLRWPRHKECPMMQNEVFQSGEQAKAPIAPLADGIGDKWQAPEVFADGAA